MELFARIADEVRAPVAHHHPGPAPAVGLPSARQPLAEKRGDKRQPRAHLRRWMLSKDAAAGQVIAPAASSRLAAAKARASAGNGLPSVPG